MRQASGPNSKRATPFYSGTSYTTTPNADWSHYRGSTNPVLNLAYADGHVATVNATDLRAGNRSQGIAPLYPLGGSDYTARLYRLGWVLEK